MNTEQAIKDLMFLKHTDLNVYSKHETYSLEPSINYAIAALREKADRENPKPLTLEQFCERCVELKISGKEAWLWCVEGDDMGWNKVSYLSRWANITNYGKTWLAYDFEPKEAR